MAWLLVLLQMAALASEGYPLDFISISQEKDKNAVIKNKSCLDITVFVNRSSYPVAGNSEVYLGTDRWSSWSWRPGRIGSMTEKEVLSPIKDKKSFEYGPGSEPTHVGEAHYGYDFQVIEGTNVMAMDDGVVIRVIEHYQHNHRDQKRLQEGNKLEILHSDGSVSVYGHLKFQSVLPQLCEKVKAGQIIALSGNTGYSSGPHLHVEMLRPTSQGNYQTFPLKFK